MLIASIGTLVYPVVVPGMPVMLIVWCAFCGFIAINIGIFSPFFHRLLVSMLTRFSMTKIAAKVDSISTALQIVWQHKWMLFASLLISIINQLAVISVTWIMALGLRLNVSFSHCVIFVPIITLISMIPISFNGMGLRERAYTSLFGGIGLLPASCLALGLMSSIITILTSLPGGIVYIFFRNRNDAQELAAFETEFS
jgi:glycosyltransferase 2 family protein